MSREAEALKVYRETVNILVSDFANESNIVRNLLFVSHNDYTTVLHSINVMALVIGYATHENYSLAEKKIARLSGAFARCWQGENCFGNSFSTQKVN